jgi:thioredoxin-dependent peroxiredoxin
MSQINQPAPNFTLPNSEGNMVSLSDYKGQKVLLVFYPGDDTMVCTKQLCSYNSGLSEFKELSVQILGINMDSVESHKKFQAKYHLQFPLLSDPDGKVCSVYQAKSLMGVKRAIFLLDENHQIIYENDTFPVFYKDKEDVLNEIRKKIS